MKKTIKIKLITNKEQHSILLSTMNMFSVVCNDISNIAFENKEFRNQLQTDKSNTVASDKKENILTDDGWSKLSGIIPIRVVKGGIKQPEFEEDFQEVRRYGNGK